LPIYCKLTVLYYKYSYTLRPTSSKVCGLHLNFKTYCKAGHSVSEKEPIFHRYVLRTLLPTQPYTEVQMQLEFKWNPLVWYYYNQWDVILTKTEYSQ